MKTTQYIRRTVLAWRLPRREILLFSMALCMLVVGAGFVVHTQVQSRATLTEVQLGSLHLRLDGRQWLVDQMHGSEAQQFPMPASMMPDMPTHGVQRLHVQSYLYNRGQNPRYVRVDEFTLHAGDGSVWSPSASTITNMALQSGHALNFSLFFDVPEDAAEFRLEWRRNSKIVALAIPDPPIGDQKHLPSINTHNHDNHAH